jgi:23S rRNA (pseudouridine1915-N3)-methyltransferase
MVRIRFIVVDRTRSPFLKEGEEFYLNRLRRYAHTEWIEVKPVTISPKIPIQGILDKEGVSITRKLTPGDYVVALDRKGKQHTSKELASHIGQTWNQNRRVALVIGGPLGLSENILNSAHERVSLSRLTLTHEMVRLVLLEQLYRAFTIIHGEKYHK